MLMYVLITILYSEYFIINISFSVRFPLFSIAIIYMVTDFYLEKSFVVGKLF